MGADRVCGCSRCGNPGFWGRIYLSHRLALLPPDLVPRQPPVKEGGRRGEERRKREREICCFLPQTLQGTFGFPLFPVREPARSLVSGPGCGCPHPRHPHILASPASPHSLHPCLMPFLRVGGRDAAQLPAACGRLSSTKYCLRRIFSPWAVLLVLQVAAFAFP